MSHDTSDAPAGDADRAAVLDTARRAKDAAVALATASRAAKDAAVDAMADALLAETPRIVAANALDLGRARAGGTSEALIDRLTLTPDRIADIAEALRSVAELPDPVGEVVRGYTLPNGLEIRQVRVPMGVIGIVY
jgi:glutamate-5-semialdehyde dehydrogenase